MPKLTPREIEISNKLYDQYKAKKRDFVKKYGADAPQIMKGRAIKLAKKIAVKQQQQRIKEAIKQVLGTKVNDKK